ncbi:magnesium/cobalt transporter CorA [Candidatus Woesearchaeota archaeon]|nr:magnesium/cobalt transporter CorA [Candidatus Woesearchaeota archaeon]
MIKVLNYKNDKAVKGSINDIPSPTKFTWVDVFEPTRNELKEISGISKISLPDLNITLRIDQRPRVVDIDGPFSLIIFGTASFEKEEITTTPIFVYVSKQRNCVITVRNKETKSIRKLEKSIETKGILFQKGSDHFVYRVLDEILNIYYEVLDDIEARIDQIEEKVLKAHEIETVQQIFKIKKTLIYFAKTMSANREVITSIEKEYLSEIDKKKAKQFRTLYNDTIQLIDMSTTYRDILTGTLDTYLSSVSNNLNKIMKTLTVGASFILIPTLIASIYGMNFREMPELYWPYGYAFAIGLMVFSIFAMWLFFKKKKWI